MKISTIIKLLCWFIAFCLLLNVSFGMMSASDTIINICGFAILAAILIVTIKTRCLININFNNNSYKNDENNNSDKNDEE